MDWAWEITKGVKISLAVKAPCSLAGGVSTERAISAIERDVPGHLGVGGFGELGI